MKTPSLETIGRYCMTLSAFGACALIAWECGAAIFAGSEPKTRMGTGAGINGSRDQTAAGHGLCDKQLVPKPGLPANSPSAAKLTGSCKTRAEDQFGSLH